MNSITVTTQKELDAINLAYSGYISINGGTKESPLVINGRLTAAVIVACGSSHVEAWGSSHVEALGSSHVVARESSHVVARGSSHVVAWGSSHVEACGSSHVEAWGSSHVVARGSSHVEAWGSSHVEALGSSHVVARESSHVEAWGSSHVEACGSSHVVAWESSHVVARESSHVVAWGESSISVKSASSITINGYAIASVNEDDKNRIRFVVGKNATLKVIPRAKPTWDSYVDRFPVDVNGGMATLYKAVHKKNGVYYSDYNNDYKYVIGETITAVCDPSTLRECSNGLHVSHLSWAKMFGYAWSDLAILECSVPIDKIVVSNECDGKVRTSELTVIREVEV